MPPSSSRRPRMDQLHAVALAGDTMPQKSDVLLPEAALRAALPLARLALDELRTPGALRSTSFGQSADRRHASHRGSRADTSPARRAMRRDRANRARRDTPAERLRVSRQAYPQPPDRCAGTHAAHGRRTPPNRTRLPRAARRSSAMRSSTAIAAFFSPIPSNSSRRRSPPARASPAPRSPPRCRHSRACTRAAASRPTPEACGRTGGVRVVPRSRRRRARARRPVGSRSK